MLKLMLRAPLAGMVDIYLERAPQAMMSSRSVVTSLAGRRVAMGIGYGEALVPNVFVNLSRLANQRLKVVVAA